MTPDSRSASPSRLELAAVTAIIIAAALALLWMGRVAICKCGYVKLWHGVVMSSENSQHIADWYSFSHIIHGFLFYGALWYFGRGWSFGSRLFLATMMECGWEVFENTDFIINRYRETTISLDYYGDSVLNSLCDSLAMILGFIAASRLPVLVIVGLGLAMELIVGAIIRDNLTLNIVMLLWPFEFLKNWQSGG